MPDDHFHLKCSRLLATIETSQFCVDFMSNIFLFLSSCPIFGCGMNLLIFTFLLCGTGLLQLSIAINSETIRGHPCFKRNKKILCPFKGSTLSNIHKASISNSSIILGPTMYSKRFTVPSVVFSADMATTTTTSIPSFTKSNTHVIYYTKQYDEGAQGQNAFDLNDEDEHHFMHEPNIEENIIDDGRQVRKIKKGRINTFIEENKALIRRMFGNDHSQSDWMFSDSQDHFSSFHYGPDSKKLRRKRSIRPTPHSNNKVDSCESTVEIVTPYWASNSAGKIRAIVNTQHLQQAIQQEVCQAVQTKRCNKDCTCEQKYKWHRLLAYDPDDDCKGIFMDWFLFPSCCVCRCTKL